MRTLILPCETRVREFDAKLLLALAAAARGIPAIVGSKKRIDLDLARYPAGVYVGKSVTARSRHNLQLAQRCGHRVALWDEEGLVWASREVYWRTKVDAATLAAPELLIAWGEENADAWRLHPDYRATPIAVAGNPRAELLLPAFAGYHADEARTLRERHGAFLLINTNFSRVNHLQPRQNRHLKWLREQRPDDPRGGFAAHKFALFNAFREMLPELARALAPVPIVLRPHPSEYARTWETLAAGVPNVEVVRGGSVAAWLAASHGVIHNGCTTAVEAFMLGRPALAYMPVRSARYDHPLPNGLSLQVDDTGALVDAARACAQDRDAAFAAQADDTRRALMARNVAGQHGPPPSALILDALAPLLSNPAPPAGARRRSAAAALALRRALRPVEACIPGAANYAPYLAHMFPDIGVDTVRERAARLGACLGLSRAPGVRRIARNVFAVAPPD